VGGWDLSADAVKKDPPSGWSELHDQCPLVVELRRENHEGTSCPRLPLVDKAPKRTIFLDLSNVKKNTYLWEIKNLLNDPTGKDPHGMAGSTTKGSDAKKTPIPRGTKRNNQGEPVQTYIVPQDGGAPPVPTPSGPPASDPSGQPAKKQKRKEERAAAKKAADQEAAATAKAAKKAAKKERKARKKAKKELAAEAAIEEAAATKEEERKKKKKKKNDDAWKKDVAAQPAAETEDGKKKKKTKKTTRTAAEATVVPQPAAETKEVAVDSVDVVGTGTVPQTVPIASGEPLPDPADEEVA